MKILFTSSEVFPFAKTGGLADVAGALPAALEQLGHDIKIVMPRYAMILKDQGQLDHRNDFKIKMGDRDYSLSLWSSRLPGTSVEVLFLGNDFLFQHSGLYQENNRDYPDNLEAFSVFSRGILEVPGILGWIPDIFHANDWQTALTFAYLIAHFKDKALYQKMGTVFTIHNIGYQGLFSATEYHRLGLPPNYFTPDTLEFYGKINLMKAGLVFAGTVTTVSPTYSREILAPEFGHGLEGVLQSRRNDLFGILNGVDYQKWNPALDSYLPRSYSNKSLEGKLACKRALQRRCKFSEKDVPLTGIISRLTAQKGLDLVLETLDELMLLDQQMVVLGVGDPGIEEALKKAADRYPDKLSVHLTFDEAFAHRVEAGADLLLMPSRYEPCGLNQLYSLRYGTIPLVRKTGGLADTVTDATPSRLLSETATGFVFETASGHSLLTALRLAFCLYKDPPLWNKMILAAMEADFSWERSAREYVTIYERSLKKIK